jgi:hypothetical protein
MLEFANDHMTDVMLFTNATPFNVDKFKSIRNKNIELCVSYYGSTAEKFKELTCTTDSLFKTFHRKLEEMDKANIKYQVFRRDENYQFDYQEGPDVNDQEFDTKKKCKYHHEPKVFANGDVSFCIFAREEWSDSKKIFYANLNNTSLTSALSDPIRYKFYESQSLCESMCSGFSRDCYIKSTIPSIKLMTMAKKAYMGNQQETDARYQSIEAEITNANV